MSNITSTNSPMRSRVPTSDFGAVDPSLRIDQQQNTVFSSEIFDPGPSSVEPSDITWPSNGAGAVIQPVSSQESETELTSKLARLSERIDQFSEQLNKLDAGFKLVNARLDSLESQATSTPTAEPAVTVLASQLETRFESLENIFKTQCEMVNGFFANTGTSANDVKVKVNVTPVAEAESNLVTNSVPAAATAPAVVTEPAVAPVEKDPALHWQQQKQAMMAKYGFESETTEPDATPVEPNTSQPKADTPSTDNSPVVSEEATVTTEEATVVSEEATVEELKRQLNSKIREAEVEMSIKRARLMQERVEYERAQAELERRTAKLEAKLAASAGDDNENTTDENNIMGRFKRHLGNS